MGSHLSGLVSLLQGHAIKIETWEEEDGHFHRWAETMVLLPALEYWVL